MAYLYMQLSVWSVSSECDIIKISRQDATLTKPPQPVEGNGPVEHVSSQRRGDLLPNDMTLKKHLMPINLTAEVKTTSKIPCDVSYQEFCSHCTAPLKQIEIYHQKQQFISLSTIEKKLFFSQHTCQHVCLLTMRLRIRFLPLPGLDLEWVDPAL